MRQGRGRGRGGRDQILPSGNHCRPSAAPCAAAESRTTTMARKRRRAFHVAARHPQLCWTTDDRRSCLDTMMMITLHFRIGRHFSPLTWALFAHKGRRNCYLEERDFLVCSLLLPVLLRSFLSFSSPDPTVFMFAHHNSTLLLRSCKGWQSEWEGASK